MITLLSLTGYFLNLYLLLKSSTVKSNIFEELQNAYGLKSLKVIKSVTTRWLSHGKAVETVLDRSEALVASLDAIYLRKKRTGSKLIYNFIVKNVRYACKKFS